MLLQVCTVLYCTVLHCTVLYCTVLYCTVLYCTVLLQVYLTTGLFVIVSWISFIVPPEVVPGIAKDANGISRQKRRMVV